jgi:hypothetical protein
MMSKRYYNIDNNQEIPPEDLPTYEGRVYINNEQGVWQQVPKAVYMEDLANRQKARSMGWDIGREDRDSFVKRSNKQMQDEIKKSATDEDKLTTIARDFYPRSGMVADENPNFAPTALPALLGDVMTQPGRALRATGTDRPFFESMGELTPTSEGKWERLGESLLQSPATPILFASAPITLGGAALAGLGAGVADEFYNPEESTASDYLAAGGVGAAIPYVSRGAKAVLFKFLGDQFNKLKPAFQTQAKELAEKIAELKNIKSPTSNQIKQMTILEKKLEAHRPLTRLEKNLDIVDNTPAIDKAVQMGKSVLKPKNKVAMGGEYDTFPLHKIDWFGDRVVTPAVTDIGINTAE